jgi:putative membrane protein
MTTYNKDRIGAAFGRGIITTVLLASGLALRAEPSDAYKAKDDASSAPYATRAGATARSGDTATCLQQAAKMNNATIKFAQLASQKAENAELKSLGQTLESDHKDAQAKLQTIAAKHNVTLPTSLEAKCQEELTKLQGLSGSEFDKEFVKGAVEGHATARAHLEQATTQAKDPDVAQYTREMLGHVKHHQQQIREVAKAVGLDQATIASLESKGQEAVGAPGASETSSATSPSRSSDKSDQQNRPAVPLEK